MLEIACNRNERRGLLRTDRLMAGHGPALPVPESGRIVAADRPRLIAEQMQGECGVHFPGWRPCRPDR
jgi:hypothetical protein